MVIEEVYEEENITNNSIIIYIYGIKIRCLCE